MSALAEKVIIRHRRQPRHRRGPPGRLFASEDAAAAIDGGKLAGKA
jgi:hypothetical protein